MSFTNAERQKRWRARRNTAARDAAYAAAELARIRSECVLCATDRDDLKEDGVPVVSTYYGHGFVCEPCTIEAAAKIEKRRAKARVSS
jgi:hypothetical protein